MTQARPGMRGNRGGMMNELFTEATLPALSIAMVNRGIDPHAIVAIVEMYGQTTTRCTPRQFRVLYEIH